MLKIVENNVNTTATVNVCGRLNMNENINNDYISWSHNKNYNLHYSYDCPKYYLNLLILNMQYILCKYVTNFLFIWLCLHNKYIGWKPSVFRHQPNNTVNSSQTQTLTLAYITTKIPAIALLSTIYVMKTYLLYRIFF